jgi:hypothetical protein
VTFDNKTFDNEKNTINDFLMNHSFRKKNKSFYLPEDIVKVIISILGYDVLEDDYIKKFVKVCEEKYIGNCDTEYSDTGCFGFFSRWAPPFDLLTEISTDFPYIVMEDEYSEEGCDFGGYFMIQNGDYLDNQEWELSTNNWEKNGGPDCINDILETVLNDGLIISTSQGENNSQNQENICQCNNIEDLKKFYKEKENPMSFIEDAIYDDVLDFTFDYELINCSDIIIREIEKILKS